LKTLRKLEKLQCTFPKLTEVNQHYVLGLAEGLKRAQKGKVGEQPKDSGKDRKGGFFMKKGKILIVGLIALLMACGLVLAGCDNPTDGDGKKEKAVNNRFLGAWSGTVVFIGKSQEATLHFDGESGTGNFVINYPNSIYGDDSGKYRTDYDSYEARLYDGVGSSDNWKKVGTATISGTTLSIIITSNNGNQGTGTFTKN